MEDRLSKRLESVYKRVEKLDLYVGMNSEQVSPVSQFPETISCVLALVAFSAVTHRRENFRTYLSAQDSFLHFK
jgi:hypothetical protein